MAITILTPGVGSNGGGGSYTLPVATESVLGGVKAKAKTTETQEVSIDNAGTLFVADGGGLGDMLKSVYDTNDNGIVDKVATLPTDTYLDEQIIKYDLASDKMIGSSLIPLIEEVLLKQFSTATTQEPSGLDTPIRIEFGSASGTPADPVQIDVTGLITINQDGAYFIKLNVQYGRSTSTGEVELFVRILINGVQTDSSVFARLDDDDTVIPTSERLLMSLVAGDTLEFELIRDSSNGGINNGGLFSGNPTTAGWNDAPSASISISRLSGDTVSLIAGGDVVGTTGSILNEITSYSDTTGKNIKGGSDISVADGILERITTGEDLWLKINSTNENVFIGRHIDTTGVPNLTNTTLLITANATNDVVLSTAGNNSQSISFVKQGVYRCGLKYDRNRNSLALENTVGGRLEILPDNTATFLVDKVGIGRVPSTDDFLISFKASSGAVGSARMTSIERDALVMTSGGGFIWNTDTDIGEAYDGTNWYQCAGEPEGCAFNTFQNTLPTLPLMIDSYVTARLGSPNIGNTKGFLLNGDSIQYTGNRMKARVSCSFDYHIPTSIVGVKGFAFAISRDFSPVTNSLRENNEVGNDGMYRSASLETILFLTNGNTLQLRLKQISGTLINDITIRNFTMTVIHG